jgi:hypothetical protein
MSRTTTPTAAGKAKPRPPAVDWLAVLRSGPVGVRRWNRLTRAVRIAVKLKGVDLGKCDLAGADLRYVDARGASFAGALLGGAKLRWARLTGTDFSAADVREADLHLTDLTAADLSAANLARSDLDSSDLRRAKLVGADLTGTKLSALLDGADLTGATLTGADLSGATFNEKTQWPEGFVVPAEAKWYGRGTDPRLVGKGKKAVAVDINGLMARLNAVIDPKRMKRTLDMLKSGKNQLFAEVEPAHVRGIVRSQRDEGLVYSCVLTDDGTYACCTPDLSPCMGLRGEPCKHILVLVIGLARAGQLDVATADRWVVAGAARNHRWNKTTKNHVSDTLLKYKGVEAGEVDWRPTETIPEDFYAM